MTLKYRLMIAYSFAAAFAAPAYAADSTTKLTNAASVNVKIEQFGGKNESAEIDVKNLSASGLRPSKLIIRQKASTDADKVGASIDIDDAGVSNAVIQQFHTTLSEPSLSSAIAIIRNTGDNNRILINQRDNPRAFATAVIRGSGADGEGEDNAISGNTIKILQERGTSFSSESGGNSTIARGVIENSSNSKIEITQKDIRGAVGDVVISANSENVSVEATQLDGAASIASAYVMNSSDTSIKAQQMGDQNRIELEGEDLRTTMIDLKQENGDNTIRFDAVTTSDSDYKIAQFGGSEIAVTIDHNHRTTLNALQTGQVRSKVTLTDTTDASISINQGTTPAGFGTTF